MQNELRDLTLKVYDAVANQGLWSSVLDQLVEQVGAQGSIVFEWVEEGGNPKLTAPIHSGFYSSDILEVYLSKCEHLEARDQAIIQRHTTDHDDIELLDDTLLAGSVEELRQQEHVRKLMKLGIFHRAAGVMNKDNRSISLFSLQLNAERDQLEGKERHLLSHLLPHLAKALDLGIPMRQLQKRYQGVLSALDRLTIGVCILDSRGMVVARNQEFQRQQETYRTFRVSQNGQLRITDNRGQKCLDVLMADLSQHGKFGARPRKENITSHALDALCIEVSPIHRSDEMGSEVFDGFLLCSTDTTLPVVCDTHRVQQAFQLTAAETSLVNAIGQGLTNPEIADRRGRSVATINAQTKSILAKSHCANRTQFVRMMMRFGASFLTRE
ncbi:helix-turn-helix transcriptional regulator [Roseobacter sp. EG26]|uniref:helix-turn-helix transcriptional regulator n=1 Tax=Roseobacter sp. EG26 TaxID=3412477 RepID=UPI003CE55FC9